MVRQRIIETVFVPAAVLKRNPGNFRTHPGDQRRDVTRILEEIGQIAALMAVRQPDGQLLLLDGHLRSDIADERVVRVDVVDLTEEESRLVLALYDHTTAMAGVNIAKLQTLIASVMVDRPLWKAQLATAASAMQAQAKASATRERVEVSEVDIPPTPATPITGFGDLWVMGDHRLLCGDSTDRKDVLRLMAGAKAEMMFTDPPYGVDYDGGHFHSGNVNVKRPREKLHADENADVYFKFLPVAVSVVDGPCYMWFAGSKARDVYNAVHKCKCEVHALIIWHKTNATYAAMNAQYKQRHEPCLYFKPAGSTLRWSGSTTEATVWNQERDGINEFHPTQKPVALAAKAIGNHDVTTVLDLFGGSGSTLIASEQLSKRCYTMEINPAYCDVAVARWEKHTGRKAQRIPAGEE